MVSRSRVVLACCLSLCIAVPIPAAALAGRPDPSADVPQPAGPVLVGKRERPSHGQADGRRSEPFSTRANGNGRARVPTTLRPAFETRSTAPANGAPAAAGLALVDDPATAFFLDGNVNSGPGAGVIKLYTEADTEIILTLDQPGAPRFAIQEIPFRQADWWYLDLQAPDGEELAPGTYEGATRAGSNEGDEPGLDFAGNGVGCNQLTGRFTIHELQRGVGGELTSLAAAFEAHCEGGPDATFGEMRSSTRVCPCRRSPSCRRRSTTDPSRSASPTVDRSPSAMSAPHRSACPASRSRVPMRAVFDVTAETCPSSLAPAEGCTVTVEFAPSVAGAREASLMIDDDSLRGSHVVRLFGSATIPGAAGASGKSPAEIVSIGTGITDVGHEDFYICSATPCIEPPDPNVAVGPDHVVQTAGALIRVTNRFGGAPLTADIFSWFAQPDDIDGFADATVAYHAGTDRYFRREHELVLRRRPDRLPRRRGFGDRRPVRRCGGSTRSGSQTAFPRLPSSASRRTSSPSG